MPLIKKKAAPAAPAKKIVPAKKPAAPAAKKPAGRPGFGGGGPKKVLSKAEQKIADEKRAARLALIAHQAPDEFKSYTLSLKFRSLHDGTIDPAVLMERIKGTWDNVDAKRVDMMDYDPRTVVGVVSRLSAVFYSSSPLKRLPASAAFQIYLRVGKRSSDNTLSVSMKAAARLVKLKGGGMKPVWFNPKEKEADKKDPVYRKLRRAIRLLRGAFIHTQPLPAARPKRASDEDEGGED